jgi:hypothetical protein
VKVGQVLDHDLVILQVDDVNVDTLSKAFQALAALAVPKRNHSNVVQMLAICQFQ